MSTVSPDSVAQDQIRSFVERIMRLREEVKAINSDIREVYAEAKGNGFDKTVLGKVVNYIEKRATSAGELAEGEALFDLYLAAFDGATRVGTPVATHTHEAAGYDRLTGEVRDQVPAQDSSGNETSSESQPLGKSKAALPASVDADANDGAQRIQTENEVVTAGETAPVQDGSGPAEVHTLGQAGSTPAPATSSAPRADTDQGASGKGAAPDLAATPSARVDADAAVDRSGQGVSSSLAQSAPVANSNKRLTFNDPAHRDCLDPAMCGGFSNLKLCQRCREASEMGQVA